MAAKGWVFEKRGILFSHFYKAEPQKLQFRAELSNSKAYDHDEIRKKQVSLYEESGWTHVGGRGMLNIFSAAEGLEAPDVYSEPEQRKDILKILRRNYSFIGLSFFFYLLIFPLLELQSRSGFSESITGTLQSIIYIWRAAYFEMTALVLFLISLVLHSLLSAILAYRKYRRFKKYGRLDRAAGRGALPSKATKAALVLCCLVFLGLHVAQLAQDQKYEMPLQADGPYLLLKDLGWEGERSAVFTSGPDTVVKISRSLLLRRWDTYECVKEKGRHYWIYQDIYEMKSRKSAADFGSILTKIPIYPGRQAFVPAQAEGLDFAYRSGTNYIAVRDNYVCCITYFEPGESAEIEAQADVFAALAAMLQGTSGLSSR